MKQLPARRVHKVWGRHDPPPPFTNPGEEPLGEIWFDPPPEFDSLLVKFLFTDAALSVQVHPDDVHAPQGHRGKSECWYILDAEPGATLAVGLIEEMSMVELRSALLDGSIEQSLRHFEVKRGDFVSVPAGTIHAIGAGISLIEVQQNSDITYRLYDYGRPRELHLDEGLRTARRGPCDPSLFTRASDCGYVEFINGPYFRVSRLVGEAAIPAGTSDRNSLILPLSHGVSLNGEALAVGSCTLAQSIAGLDLESEASVILVSDRSEETANYLAPDRKRI